MMRLILAGIAVGALAGGVGAWKWRQGTIDALEADVASLTRSVAALEASRDQSILAREVADATAAREVEEARTTAANVIAILTADLEECADAPIDPDLRSILDGLHTVD